jgi:hypothetical protein
MSSDSLVIIIPVLITALALIGFLVFRNRKDRKELITPEAMDPLEEEKREQKREEDQL